MEASKRFWIFILITFFVVIGITASSLSNNSTQKHGNSHKHRSLDDIVCSPGNYLRCDAKCEILYQCDNGKPTVMEDCTLKRKHCFEPEQRCSSVNICPAGGKSCTGPGLFPDPWDCKYYHECSSEGAASVLKSCNGSRFDIKTQTCAFGVENKCTEKSYPKCNKLGETGNVKGTQFFYYCLKQDDILYPVVLKCEDEEIFDTETYVCTEDTTTIDESPVTNDTVIEDSTVFEDTSVTVDSSVTDDTTVKKDTPVTDDTTVKKDTHVTDDTTVKKDTPVTEDTAATAVDTTFTDNPTASDDTNNTKVMELPTVTDDTTVTDSTTVTTSGTAPTSHGKVTTTRKTLTISPHRSVKENVMFLEVGIFSTVIVLVVIGLVLFCLRKKRRQRPNTRTLRAEFKPKSNI